VKSSKPPPKLKKRQIVVCLGTTLEASHIDSKLNSRRYLDNHD
jgi:hypothetical protein